MWRVSLPKPTPRIRTVVFLVGDILIWSLALCAAFLIRFEGTIPEGQLRRLPLYLLLLVPPKVAWHAIFRLYKVTWRLVGITDLLNVWKANSMGWLSAVAAMYLLRPQIGLGITSRSVLVLDYLLSVGGIALFRFGRRLWDLQRDGLRRRRDGVAAKRVLLVGAGAAGERLARAMLDDPQARYRPVGFIDDDANKHGSYVHGLLVFGDRRVIPEVVRGQRAEEIVLAIPSASSGVLRGIVEWARQSDAQQIRVLPGVHELLTGKARLRDVREVAVEDLLGRASVEVDLAGLGAWLQGKRVLVTGAAGSIGGELVRQLTRFPCGEIVGVDINETGLFDLEEQVAALESGVAFRPVIADVREREKVEWVVRTVAPHVIFHAAAYKHVPLMERHTEEAVKTNVLGTFIMAEAAVRAGVQTFVLISTDKAVQPNSVMGATKRVAERVGQALAERGRTRFLAVRFGNVLGSRGSLIPVLQEQIRRGGPITLTHPDMRRYFMSIAEAVLLVLQAVLTERQSGVFVLDMGEPVRIVDLATELIKLSGLEPDKDITFVYTGVRPGEKIEEELVEADEALLPTPHPKIYEIRSDEVPYEMALRLALQELERLALAMDAEGIRRLLTHLAGKEWMASALPAASGMHST